MVFTYVNVTMHEGSFEFSDLVYSNKFYNFGVQALAALKAHKTIDIRFPERDVDPASEYIIPYHAVMRWRVTKEEGEYTKPEDAFCKSESTPTGDITLLDGTYEFTDAGYITKLDKCYDAANVTVTIDGTTATLPEFAENRYGEFGEDDNPVFTTYPAAVILSNRSGGARLTVVTPTTGEHTVTVTVPNGSETACR